jgi:hypothetical protein
MLDCDKITNETRDLMFKLIEETEKDGKERGMLLLENNNRITNSNVCIGEVCRVQISGNVPKSLKYKGRYHTHPSKKFAPIEGSGKDVPSFTDVISAASHTKEGQSLCIGYSDQKKYIIKCYDINNENLSKLGEEAYKLIRKGDIEKVKSTVYDMRNILKNWDPIYKYRIDRPDFLETKCILKKLI